MINEWSENRPITAATRSERWRPAPFGVLGDERLAQRAGAGDDRAFAVVYQRYHQILYRYCRSILNNDADAQDALQSTFAAAFASLRAGQRDAPMRPWLFRIAHNESISILRRRRPAVELSQAPEHATSSIEDQVAERAALSVLLRDLHQLTDRQRSALVLRELSGLSHQEIAIALGTSVGAAKQTIFEARQTLFEFAEGRAMACDEIRRTISDADGRSLRSRRVQAHLRECAGCAAFAAAIPARTGELRALAPALPGVAGAGLLGRIAVSSAGRSGGAGLARLAAGAAAKTASASTGFGANALAGVAVVATATAGVTVGVGKLVQEMPHRETVRSGVYAPPRPARTAPEAPGSLLGAAARPRARAAGVPGGAATGTRTRRLAPIVRSSVTGGRAATPGGCASTDPTLGRDRLAAAPVDKRVRARHSPTAIDAGGGAHPRRPDRIRPPRQAPRRRRRPGLRDRPTARERAITARVTPRGRHPDSPGPGRPPRTDQTRLPGPAPRHRCERPSYGERERHGWQRDHGGGGSTTAVGTVTSTAVGTVTSTLAGVLPGRPLDQASP